MRWDNPTVDIVPLFEVIDDLQQADSIMEALYTNTAYRNTSTIGTLSKPLCSVILTEPKTVAISWPTGASTKPRKPSPRYRAEHGIKVVFFDGRGGPPARGGGKTHKFYASLGPTIENHEIQITIQGQTISSNLGTLDSSRYNLENLLSAGSTNQVFTDEVKMLSADDKELLATLAFGLYQIHRF
jgi:phosphoenolpyruvate carboxylase